MTGDVHEADAAFARGVELLEENGRWWEAAQAARAWGRLLREGGREADASQAFERAADLAMRASPRNRAQQRS